MPSHRLKPGSEHVHRGAIWQVEKVELRGVDEHWAKLVRYEGLGKTARLVNVEWIRFDNNNGGKNDETQG